MSRRPAVLSIDGCGFRGRTQLLLLQELMLKMRASVSDPVKRPCEVFDLIVGTAAGGLIAILLGRLGMSCDEALTAYTALESQLFLNPAQTKPLTIAEILTNPNQFDTVPFENKLRDIIPVALGPNALMFDPASTTGCRTMVTLVSKSAFTDTDAYRIRSYSDPKLTRVPPAPDPEPLVGHSWKICEAAFGTTRCPGLFSALDLHGSSFQAANASGFSNPSMIAYIEALDLFGNESRITLISLGMGLRNRHDYSPTIDDGDINHALAQIASGLNTVGNNRLREFVRQTQLVATSTQIKHLRVAERIGRVGSLQSYYRFDPPRERRAMIMVDFGQMQVIDDIVKAYLLDSTYAQLWKDGADNLRATSLKEWHWQVLQGYTCDGSGTVVDTQSGKTSTQMMQACYNWEAGSSRPFVTCFTIDATGQSQMITGPLTAEREDDTTLYVRVLLDDNWSFFPRRRVRTIRLEEDVLNGMSNFSSPVEAIQTVSTNPNIKAFNSDGWGTQNVVTRRNLVNDNATTAEYHGVWLRN